MSNEELDSQLSAMFDDELPASECELLARRLARDEQLRARWGRYAAISACIRGEHGVQLETAPRGQISAVIKQDVSVTAAPAAGIGRRRRFGRWATSLAGLASAAAVAAIAILVVRSEGPAVVAQNVPTQQPVVQSNPAPMLAPPTAPVAAPPQGTQVASVGHPNRSHEPDSYVVPATAAQGPSLVPPTELAITSLRIVRTPAR